jgi:hypothetical protein
MHSFRSVEEALQAHFSNLKQSLKTCNNSLELIKLESDLKKAKDLVERMETDTATLRDFSQRQQNKTLITGYNRDLDAIE